MAKKSTKKKKIEKVLVPKIGQEEKFLDALRSAQQIGNGKLGWDGQAEMMLDLGLLPSVGIKLKKGTREQQLKQVKELLQQCFVDNINTYGEWVTPKVAKTRKLLYASKLDDKKETV